MKASSTKKYLGLFALLMCAWVLQYALTSCTPEKDSWQDYPMSTAYNIEDSSDVAGPTQDLAILDLSGWADVEDLEKELGMKLTLHSSDPLASRDMYTALVPEGSVGTLKAYLQEKHPYSVESVSEEHLVKSFDMGMTRWSPNDPLYQFQWHLDAIETEEAWTLSTGRGSIVAVIDTGVALGQRGNLRPVQDLNPTHIEGFDFVNNHNQPWDDQGHGTHVAGSIAQTTHNKYGGAGVAPGALIMPIKVLDKTGSGKNSDVIAGIYFAADNGAHIINLSLGSAHASDLGQEAVSYATSRGTLVIAAAGNNGKRTPLYPAGYDDVVAVAATQYDGHTTFYSQWGSFVDIAAPGGNTQVDQNKDGKPDGILQETVKSGSPDKHEFALYMGTSMASPHVAGVAALINQWGVTHPKAVEYYLTRHPDQSRLMTDPEDKKESLYTNLGSKRPDVYTPKEFSDRYGAGILQADSAVSAAIMEPGILRFILALVLGFLMFLAARQESILEADTKLLAMYLGTASWMAAGFFFLPFVMPGMDISSVVTVTQFLSTPLFKWDWILFGSTQTPLFANALIPAGILFLLHGMPRLKYVGAGVGVGTAAFLLSEVMLLTSPLLWIPGGDLVTRLYYIVNAVVILAITYLSLAKKGEF